MATSDAPLNVPNVTLAVARGAGSGSASGGTSALSWSAPQGFEAGAELIIETDGTFDFGSDAPEFLFCAYVPLIADGEQMDVADLFLGPGVTVQGTGPKAGPSTQSSAAMPGGKAFQIGNNSETDLNNDSETQRFRVNTPNHTKGFESRVIYMPDAHSQAIYQALFVDPIPAGTGSNFAWQQKVLWNLAGEEFGSLDSNFFNGGIENKTGQTDDFRSSQFISSNVSGMGHDFNNNAGEGQILRGSRFIPLRSIGNGGEFKVPLDSPYTYEFAWDQGDTTLSSNFTGRAYINLSNTVEGEQVHGLIQNDQFHNPSGPVKEINSFTFPGYIRGYQKAFNHHWLMQDVWKQKGWSRVAVCDNPDYFQAKNRVQLIPVSWINNRLVYEQRDGWWPVTDFAGKYICVIGPDNEQIGLGVQI